MILKMPYNVGQAPMFLLFSEDCEITKSSA